LQFIDKISLKLDSNSSLLLEYVRQFVLHLMLLQFSVIDSTIHW